MTSSGRHTEHHRMHRLGWLRAFVLGANDGILTTASILLGMAAGQADNRSVILAGLAGLFAGAGSMAVGEWVSVTSQADMEKAELAHEQRELKRAPAAELEELKLIYVDRGLSEPLAQQVAEELSSRDALAAHARDELGLHEITAAQPLTAAFSSALAFSLGGLLPLIFAVFGPPAWRGPLIFAGTLIALAVLGALSARAGRAPWIPAVVRVTLCGIVAMGVTTVIGRLFHVAI